MSAGILKSLVFADLCPRLVGTAADQSAGGGVYVRRVIHKAVLGFRIIGGVVFSFFRDFFFRHRGFVT